MCMFRTVDTICRVGQLMCLTLAWLVVATFGADRAMAVALPVPAVFGEPSTMIPPCDGPCTPLERFNLYWSDEVTLWCFVITPTNDYQRQEKIVQPFDCQNGVYYLCFEPDWVQACASYLGEPPCPSGSCDPGG